MEVSNASYSDTKMRVVVGVSCCLSIFGSLLIILSYVLFKETRIIVRTILLHVSLMDLGVAVATLICLSSDLDRFYVEMPSNVVKSCKIQGFFAVYCTLASFLWTITFAALLATGSSDYPWFGCKSIACFWVVSIVVCYSLPLLVSLWLVLTGKLGCPPLHSYSLRLRMDIDEEYGNTNIFSVVFGYDLWVYLTMVILPILYLSAAIGSHDYYWLVSE